MSALPAAIQQALAPFAPPAELPELQKFVVTYRNRNSHGEGIVMAYTTADAIVKGIEQLIDPDETIPDGPMMLVATPARTPR